jgi:ADP-ribose pyrophosphatase YjhB (NUDIX family)
MSGFKNEKEFLKNYDRTKYKSPSLTADIAVFSIIKDEENNYRKLPSKKLSILLIKRGGYPFKDRWALPGGFVREGESAQDAAARELAEETGIKDVYLRQEGLFSDKSRDPRGWVVSASFSALVESDMALASKNDAKEAKWFAINYKKVRENGKVLKDGWTSSAKYELSLCAQNEKLTAAVEIETKSSIYSNHIQYKILNSKGFAFDHAKIIAFAINDLRKE